MSFVCIPIGGGDSAFFRKVGASGDELFVFGDGVDLCVVHDVLFLFLESNVQQNVEYTSTNAKMIQNRYTLHEI